MVVFAQKMLVFLIGCAATVLIVGIVARLFVFEDASKADSQHPTSPTKPPEPADDRPVEPLPT